MTYHNARSARPKASEDRGRAARGRALFATGSAIALLGLWAPPCLAAAEDAASSTQIEEVVVTARKRDEAIQSTPVAVTAVSGAQLEARAALDITDVKTMTPNIVIDHNQAGANAANISIRGISFEDIEKSFDPAVGVIIDGVYIGTNTGQLAHVFDVDRLQVLRGPQGTLFGRNTTGGVITLDHSRPTGELGAKVSGTFGSYGQREGSLILNLPKVGDTLSAKLFFNYAQTDGYLRNGVTGKRTPGEIYRYMGGTVLFEPTANLSALLTYSYTVNDGHTAYSTLSQSSTDLICMLPAGSPGAPPANQCNRTGRKDIYTVFGTGANQYTYNEHFARGEINWQLGSVKLTSVTGYIKSTESNTGEDFDATSANFFSIDRGPLPYTQFSEELRAAGAIGDTINYVAGAYYFRSSYENDQHTCLGFIPLTLNPIARQVSRTQALFGEVDWSFAPKWRLTLGARQTWDKKSGSLIEYLVDRSTGIVIFDTGPFQKSWSALTPKVSIDYRPNEDVLLYGSYTKGYRAGGFSGRGGSALSATPPYNPETVKSFELGAKTTWLDRRLQINAAAFMTKYDNKQEEIVVPGPIAGTNETIIVNAAQATIKGVELEGQAVLAPGLKAHAAASYLDAKYDHFDAFDPVTLAPVDVNTRTMRRAPKSTFSAGLDYVIPTSGGDWALSANYSHVAPYQLSIAPDPVIGFGYNDRRCRTDPQDLLDSSVTWTRGMGSGEARISAWGRNLLDDRGLSSCLPVAGLWTFASARPPRTIGLTFGYKF